MIDAARLDAYLTQITADNLFSGVVAVYDGETPLFERAYGYANIEWQMPNRLDTRFRVASISKLFTAVAVLQLVSEGALELETPVMPYLRLGRTRIPAEVTVAQLLSMTAGIADYFEESEEWAAEWERLQRDYPIPLLRSNHDYLPLFSGLEPRAAPGTGFLYSNAGYILLGLLIEKADRRGYFEAIERRIFDPAGMDASGFFALDEVRTHVAEGYIPQMDAQGRPYGWKKNIYAVTPMGAADGGAVCTARDLQRFSNALRRGTLLPAHMLDLFLAPRVLQDEALYRGYQWMYGYGAEFLLDGNDEVVRWGKGGEEDGASCRFFHYPMLEVDVILLANQSWCAGEVAWAIHDLLMG